MTAATGGHREHHWDALRAFLMLLGIPYHVALAYRPGKEWIVHSGEGATLLTYLSEAIHLFRMPAFFVIAGYFAAMLLARKSPGVWLSGRYVRLGVPLIFSLVTLIPLLNMMCELSTLPWNSTVRSFEHNSATSGGYWVRHLWFLIVLLQCCSLAALFAWRYPALARTSVASRIDRWIARFILPVTAIVALGIAAWEAGAVELFYHAGLATPLPQEILRIEDFIGHAPYFLLGFLIQRTPATLDRLTHFSPVIALFGAGAIALNLVYLDAQAPWLFRFIGAVGAIGVTQSLIALARSMANRPHPFVERLVPASFVIYLFHVPIVAMLVVAGQHVAMPVALKAAVVMLLALGLSYGAWMIVRSSTLLRFLFGSPQPSPDRTARLRPAYAR